MTTFLADTWHLFVRHVRTTIRIPIWIAVTLIQPVIWLTLYGQLFRRVVDLPGFESGSYIQFLTPGVVIMTGLFGSAWAGMGLLQDLDEGVMDRLLATPVHRGAIIAARVMHASATVTAQSLIILLFGLVLGATIPGGVTAVLAIIVLAALLGAGFSALSNGVAVLVRREEALIGIINFFGLPLTFLSTAFMAGGLLPGWISTVARFNPVNWGVNAARFAMQGEAWGDVVRHAVYLALFAALATFFATQAFRVYRRAN